MIPPSPQVSRIIWPLILIYLMAAKSKQSLSGSLNLKDNIQELLHSKELSQSLPSFQATHG